MIDKSKKLNKYAYIIVEYPGYSIFHSKKVDSKFILSNTLIVYDGVGSGFKVKGDQIFVCGWALGAVCAIFLSSRRNPGAVFLASAFASMKN